VAAEAKDWASVLRAEWDARARSEFRDHFIASIPNFADPAAWARQAEIDATLVLHGLAPAATLILSARFARVARRRSRA
jgi:hypothetical protein